MEFASLADLLQSLIISDRNVFLLLFLALEESSTIKTQTNVNVLHHNLSGMVSTVYLVLQDKIGILFPLNASHVQLNKDGIKVLNHALDALWVQSLILLQNLVSSQILLALEAKFTTQIQEFVNALLHNHIGMVLLAYHAPIIKTGA